MKNISRIIYIILSFFVLAILILFILFKLYSKQEISFQGTGNSMDNIRQYAGIAENEKYIVFCKDINQAGLYYINKSTMEYKKINDSDSNMIYCLNIVDENIYYNIRGDIYKYDIKTGTDIVISNKDTYSTIVNDNYIYTIKPDNDGNSKLYKMDLNGKNKKVIIENFNEYYIYNDIIYFSNTQDKYNLYCCDLNGLNIKKVSNAPVDNISVHNNKIFVVDLNERVLYKMDLNGENKSKLCDYKIQCINITDDKILFSADDKLYLANLDFTKVEILSEGIFSNINVVNDVILYRRPVTDRFGNEGVYIMDINKKVELESSLKNLYLIIEQRCNETGDGSKLLKKSIFLS